MEAELFGVLKSISSVAIVSQLFSLVALAEVEGSPLPCRTGCTDKLEEARALGGFGL